MTKGLKNSPPSPFPIGFIVECGENKYKGKLQERLNDDCKKLSSDNQLNSVFRIRGAASDISTKLLFGKRTIELEVAPKVSAPANLEEEESFIEEVNRGEFDSQSERVDKSFSAS